MKSVVAVVFFLLPAAALAADEPEVVYAKYHRAAMASDLDDMLNFGPAKRRAVCRACPRRTARRR